MRISWCAASRHGRHILGLPELVHKRRQVMKPRIHLLKPGAERAPHICMSSWRRQARHVVKFNDSFHSLRNECIFGVLRDALGMALLRGDDLDDRPDGTLWRRGLLTPWRCAPPRTAQAHLQALTLGSELVTKPKPLLQMQCFALLT